MKILHLTLKKKWFDMIASGEKKEEYRENKGHWRTRFGYNGTRLERKTFDAILFRNGYRESSPSILVQCNGMGLGCVEEMKEGWYDEKPKDNEVFIIKLGKVITISKRDFEKEYEEAKAKSYDAIVAICDYYLLMRDEIFKKSRRTEIREPRQIAMYVLREKLKYSQENIAKIFNMDRTTVINSCKAVQNMLDTNYLSADHIIYKYIKKS